MQVTFESDEKTVRFNIDNKKLLAARSTSELRSLGRFLVGEVNRLKPSGSNIFVKLKDQNQEYDGLIYTPTRFMAKIRKAVEADKSCIKCKKFVYCACHDTCHKCEPCEAASKTLGVMERFTDRIYECAIYQITKYDDINENASRDRGEAGYD